MVVTLAPPPHTPFQFSPANQYCLPGASKLRRHVSLPYRTHCKSALHAFAESAPSVVGRHRPQTSLYEVLRVNRNASAAEIRTAYRSLAKMFHPDASESDGRDFIEIRKAYATLSDPAARALYDLSWCPAAASGGQQPFRYSMANRYPAVCYTTSWWETDQCW